MLTHAKSPRLAQTASVSECVQMSLPQPTFFPCSPLSHSFIHSTLYWAPSMCQALGPCSHRTDTLVELSYTHRLTRKPNGLCLTPSPRVPTPPQVLGLCCRDGPLCGPAHPQHYLECSTGMEHLVMMLPTMMASRRVQVPDSHSGIRMPGEGQRGTVTSSPE